MMSNMKATLISRARIIVAEDAFLEWVIWKVPLAVAGSAHAYKYRLAYVVGGACVLRYDGGKGDHRHCDGQESAYAFTTPEGLLADFRQDMARWNDENGRARGT